MEDDGEASMPSSRKRCRRLALSEDSELGDEDNGVAQAGAKDTVSETAERYLCHAKYEGAQPPSMRHSCGREVHCD